MQRSGGRNKGSSGKSSSSAFNKGSEKITFDSSSNGSRLNKGRYASTHDHNDDDEEEEEEEDNVLDLGIGDDSDDDDSDDDDSDDSEDDDDDDDDDREGDDDDDDDSDIDMESDPDDVDDVKHVINKLPAAMRSKIYSKEKIDVNDLEDDDLESDEDAAGEEGKWGQKKAYYSGDNDDSDIDDEALAAEDLYKKRMTRIKNSDFMDDGEDALDLDSSDDDAKKKKSKSKSKVSSAVKDKVMGDLELVALGRGADVDIQLESLSRDFTKMSKSQKLKIIESESPELKGILQDVKERLVDLDKRINPIKKLMDDCANNNTDLKDFNKSSIYNYYALLQQLTVSYCSNVCFYLYLKTNSEVSGGSSNNVDTRTHPITKQMLEFRYAMDKIRSVERLLADDIESVNKVANLSSSEASEVFISMNANINDAPIDMSSGDVGEEEDDEDFGDEEDDDDVEEDDDDDDDGFGFGGEEDEEDDYEEEDFNADRFHKDNRKDEKEFMKKSAKKATDTLSNSKDAKKMSELLSSKIGSGSSGKRSLGKGKGNMDDFSDFKLFDDLQKGGGKNSKKNSSSTKSKVQDKKTTLSAGDKLKSALLGTSNAKTSLASAVDVFVHGDKEAREKKAKAKARALGDEVMAPLKDRWALNANPAVLKNQERERSGDDDSNSNSYDKNNNRNKNNNNNRNNNSSDRSSNKKRPREEDYLDNGRVNFRDRKKDRDYDKQFK